MKNSVYVSIILQLLKWIWNTLFHQFVSIVLVYAIWIPIQHYTSPFSWHVILCTLGVVPLIAESLILFSSNNVWSQELPKKPKCLLHGCMTFIGTFLLITGIALEIERKTHYPQMTHFTSAHAIIGLIAVIVIFLALLCGPFALTSSIFGKFSNSTWVKISHNILGLVGYILAIISLILGIHSSWFEFYTSHMSRIAVTILSLIIALWISVLSVKTLYNYITTMRR